jgi:hypothetical protein
MWLLGIKDPNHPGIPFDFLTCRLRCRRQKKGSRVGVLTPSAVASERSRQHAPRAGRGVPRIECVEGQRGGARVCVPVSVLLLAPGGAGPVVLAQANLAKP